MLTYLALFVTISRRPLMEQHKKQQPVVLGVVEEALPNTLFRVKLESGETILTYLSGKMRMYRIKVLVGDRVEITIDPYGGKGRIVRRL